MKRRYTSEEEKEIVEMYKMGLSEVKIGKMLDVDSSTIHRVLVRNKINTRKQRGIKIPNSEIVKILNRIDNGERQYKIAEDYGVCPSAISLLLKRRRLFIPNNEKGED